MKLHFDIDKLQKVADDFFYATGIGIYIIAGDDFSGIKIRRTAHNPYCNAIRNAPSGRERCKISDDILFEKCKKSGKPEVHICHGGLVNIATPITYENEVIGYVFFYSLREKSFEEAAVSVKDLSLDYRLLEESYYCVPEYDAGRFRSVVDLAVMLIEHVMLLNMITPTAGDNLQRAKDFIEENISNARLA